MTNFPRYQGVENAKTAPAAGRMAVILFGAGLCLAFGLGQLHLQFALNDLRRETGKLQAKKMELRAEINSMRSEVESQKQGARLLRYAEAELGMIQSPAKAERMTIAASIRSRFDGTAAPKAKPAPSGEELNRTADVLASRSTLDGRAVAEHKGTE